MKLWLKYSAGIIFGAALALVAPASLFAEGAAVAIAAELALRLGYYVFIALLAVNLPLSVFKLSGEKAFWRTILKSMAFFLASTLVASAIGIGGALAAGPSRLPLGANAGLGMSAPIQGGTSPIFALLPKNLGALLSFSGDIGAPLLLFGLALGLAMAHDPAAAVPFADVLDSLSRIFYTINTFSSEILGLLLIPASAKAFRDISVPVSGGNYRILFLILGAGMFIIVFGLMPLFLYFINGRKNPFPYLYACLPAMLASLASGNLRFSAGVLVRSVGEDLGLPRRRSSVSLVVGLAAGRVGTAFVSSATAVFILSSYSSLAVSPLNLLLLGLIVPLGCISTSWGIPGGPMGVLAFVFGIFGKGFESGYLAAVPLAIALSAFASCLDLVWIGICSPFCAGRRGSGALKPIRHFI
ncbi:MAG TPA: cation:dicarboxylase symporter family transporter [Rectinemataceae bacterium]